MILDIILGLITVSARPTKAKTPAKVGNMLEKDFHAIFNALFVFLSL